MSIIQGLKNNLNSSLSLIWTSSILLTLGPLPIQQERFRKLLGQENVLFPDYQTGVFSRLDY